MKKQTFIVKAYDADGKMLDFWRWSCKRAGTCRKKHIDAYRSYGNLFGLDRTDRLVCYATPDGVNESEVTWELSHDEIIKEMEARHGI